MSRGTISLFKLGIKVELDQIKLIFERIIYERPKKANQYKLPHPSLVHHFLVDLGIPAMPTNIHSIYIPTLGCDNLLTWMEC